MNELIKHTNNLYKYSVEKYFFKCKNIYVDIIKTYINN